MSVRKLTLDTCSAEQGRRRVVRTLSVGPRLVSCGQGRAFTAGIRCGALECGSLLPLSPKPACWRESATTVEFPASKLAGRKAAASCRTPKLCMLGVGRTCSENTPTFRQSPRARGLFGVFSCFGVSLSDMSDCFIGSRLVRKGKERPRTYFVSPDGTQYE